MKCYYDILDIDKSASPEIIKKAYYKLSLKWHPDKNPENAAEATENFQEIQRAYKVLSNPQERAWYDKNRERFIYMNFNSEDELYDLINNIIYHGFNNDKSGFYAVHKNIFDVLIEREYESCRIRGEKMETIPEFGDSSSDYKEVVSPFYSFWESFNTKMSFHWKNKHEINLTYPRDVRRIMEKENSEMRTASRKEYNKVIQNFIINLKLRDPRIKSWKEQLNNKAKDNQRKAVLMAQKAWERSQQKMNLHNAIPNYGDVSVEELEEKLKSLEMEHGMTAADCNSEPEDLYCVACNKYFKSLAAFSNHERSKNHNKNLSSLRKIMLKENKELFSDFINSDPVIEPQLEVNAKLLDESEINENEILEPVKESASLEIDEITSIVESKEVISQDSKPESQFDKKSVKKRRRKTNPENIDNQTESVEQSHNSLICERCGTSFSSRNNLFLHIKSTGHATIKSKQSTKIKNK